MCANPETPDLVIQYGVTPSLTSDAFILDLSIYKKGKMIFALNQDTE